MVVSVVCARYVLHFVRCEHVDKEVPELFRKGGPLYGSLSHCGMGCAVESEEAIGDVCALHEDRLRSNRVLESHVRLNLDPLAPVQSKHVFSF